MKLNIGFKESEQQIYEISVHEQYILFDLKL